MAVFQAALQMTMVMLLAAGAVRPATAGVGDNVRAFANDPLGAASMAQASADNASVQQTLKAAESEVLRSRAALASLVQEPAHHPAASVQTPHLSAKDIPPQWSAEDINAAKTQLAAEWSEIAARITKARAEIQRRLAEAGTVRELIAKLESTLPMARQREIDFQALAAQGDISQHATQDRVRERIEMERDLGTQRARLQEANAALRESEHALSAYLAETGRTLRQKEAEAELKRSQASQEQTKAAYREKLTTLTSPVSGIVQQLAVHTEGGVVTEAQALLVVVPDDVTVTAEVMLENKDIGFVQVGQEAEIKLETFLFTRYGTIPATVKTVTADAVTDEKKGAIFPVTLAVSSNTIDVDGKAIRLSPGMNLTAEIKTGRRRLIEYLLSPVQRAMKESLRER